MHANRADTQHLNLGFIYMLVNHLEQPSFGQLFLQLCKSNAWMWRTCATPFLHTNSTWRSYLGRLHEFQLSSFASAVVCLCIHETNRVFLLVIIGAFCSMFWSWSHLLILLSREGEGHEIQKRRFWGIKKTDFPSLLLLNKINKHHLFHPSNQTSRPISYQESSICQAQSSPVCLLPPTPWYH